MKVKNNQKKKKGIERKVFCLDGYHGPGFKQDRRPGPGSDLERELGGAEERELHGLENGLNLLPLRGQQMLPRHGPIARVLLQEALAEHYGGYSSLSSVPHRDSAPSAFPRDSLDRVIQKGSIQQT